MRLFLSHNDLHYRRIEHFHGIGGVDVPEVAFLHLSDFLLDIEVFQHVFSVVQAYVKAALIPDFS